MQYMEILKYSASTSRLETQVKNKYHTVTLNYRAWVIAVLEKVPNSHTCVRTEIKYKIGNSESSIRTVLE